MQSGCNPVPFGPIFPVLLPLLISLSVLGLFAGAGLVALGRLRLGATSALEGLALGMLPALVLLRLLPHAYESLGLWALALAALGFGAVSLSHHAGERAEARLGGALVLPALILHAVTDGAALAISNTGRVGDSAGLLAFAAILHRIPEGFFIASRQRSRGAPAALLAAAPLALATIAGALLGQRIFNVLPDSALDGVLALGAGAMLRLFVHSHDEAPAPPPPAARAIAAAALLFGLIIVLAVPGPDDVLQSAQPRELPIAHSLLPLFIESAPALLIGLVLSSLLRAQAQRLSLGLLDGQALRGLAWGFAQQQRPAELPSELPRLRSDGARPAWIAGLCVAASLLGIETIALSFAWLGPSVAVARVLGSVLLALAIGLGAARYVRQAMSHENHRNHAVAFSPEPTRTPQLWQLLQRSLDDGAAFIVLGLLLSAALEAALTPELVQQLPAPWHSLLACIIAILGHVSALTMVPVVAVLLHKGLSLGAGLTLLWLSPLAGISLALWLGRRPTIATTLIASVSTSAVCVALAQVVERLLTKHDVPELHPLVAHDCSPWEYASAALLALLLIRSLMRLGPRGFASTRPPPSSERALCAQPH